MTWQDVINGAYELFGGVFILMHILKLLKDKKVRGVSVIPVVYFATWGIWNLYYYPSLNQWASFIGGLGVVTTNIVWIFLMLYFIRKEKNFTIIKEK